MTSNAGAQRIVDPKNLGFATEKSETKDYEKMKSNVMEEVKRSFKPEFINRIDDIIVFHQLNNENMKEIVNLLASNLYKRCEDQLGIHLTITAALKEHLVSKYADNKMGARPLKRAIQGIRRIQGWKSCIYREKLSICNYSVTQFAKSLLQSVPFAH